MLADFDAIVDAAAEAARTGGLLAFGGSGLRRKPMAAAEAIRRAGIRGLRILAHVGGPEVDLLVAAGLVREVVFSYVGFEFLGVAPHFRRAREAGAIRAEEWSEFGIIAGLRAGAERVPFHPVHGGTGSDIRRTAPLREVESPYDPDAGCLAVPALRPAVAIVHCDAARADGAAFVSGDPYADRLLGLASDRLLVTAERIVAPGEEPGPALFLPPDVAAVVPAPGGSGATSCPPCRGIDVEALVACLAEAEAARGQPEAARTAGAGAASTGVAARGDADGRTRNGFDGIAVETTARARGEANRGPVLPQQELADLVVCAMARAMGDDEVAAAALPCALLAALLARAVHNPRLLVLGSLGRPLSPRAWQDGSEFRLSLTRDEEMAARFSEGAYGLDDAFGYVLRGRLSIWISPAQLDSRGSANISAVGPWGSPKVALVGSRGLPDDGWHLREMRYYVPIHNRRAFPDEVDFRSAPGFTDERRRLGRRAGAPGTVVTSLGVFRFEPGGMRAVSLHPGVDPDEVRAETGFPVLGLGEAARSPRTPPPSEAEGAWLARLDPLRVRDVEFLPPAAARELAVEIARAEGRRAAGAAAAAGVTTTEGGGA